MRQLILAQPFSYFLDLDNALEPNNITLVSTPNVPENYLPEQDSYFDSDEFDSYALVLQQELKERTLITA